MLAKELLQEEFRFTSFDSGGELYFPQGFFKDPYVVGFLHGYLVTTADVCSARRRKRWNSQESIEFMVSAAEAVIGPEKARDFIGEPRRCKDTQGYKDAYFAGNTYIKAIFANKSLTEDNHLVVEARRVISERKEFLNEMFPSPRQGDFMSWAIQEISIKRHVALTYLVGD